MTRFIRFNFTILIFNTDHFILLPIGNFVALGTMEPFIDIWDVDVVDTLEPVVSLGRRKKKKSRKVCRQITSVHAFTCS